MQGYAEGVPIDTDVNLAANTDAFVPSQRAVKSYVGTKLAEVTAGEGPKYGCVVRHATGGQVTTLSNWTALTFDTEIRDDGGCWNIANPTRFYAPVAGYYSFQFSASYTGPSSASDMYDVTINGLKTINLGKQAAYSEERFTFSCLTYMAAGDYLEGRVFTSGSTRTLRGPLSWNNWPEAVFALVGVGTFGLTSAGNAPVDPPTVAVRASADQALTASTANIISFNTELVDTGGFWTAGSPTRFTIPAGQAGTYLLAATVRVETVSTGNVYLQFLVNGVTNRYAQLEYAVNNSYTLVSTSGVLTLAAGDYVELVVYPSTASAVNKAMAGSGAGDHQTPLFTMTRLVASYAGREKLNASRTYYVRTDGSDSNTGLANTAGGAFLTPQKAIDVVSGSLDMGTYQVTIQLGNGTYTLSTFIECKPYVGSAVPRILGDIATPSNVVLTRSSTGVVVYSPTSNPWRLSGLTISNTGSGSSDGIRVFGGIIYGESLRFGGVTRYMINVDTGGVFSAETAITVAGNAAAFIVAGISGTVTMGGATVTMSGTPAFSSWTVLSSSGGVVFAGNTWSGAATGTRYLANLNGVINVNAGGVNWIPGNVAGSTATGGQYA